MGFQPLGDRVLIKRLEEAEQKTSGGIYIPDTAKEKPQRGEVVAVGPGQMTEDGKTLPMNVKVGDVVLFGKYGGYDVEIDNEEYLIIKQDEVYGLITSEKKKKK